jgi:hypothetical protein
MNQAIGAALSLYEKKVVPLLIGEKLVPEQNEL